MCGVISVRVRTTNRPNRINDQYHFHCRDDAGDASRDARRPYSLHVFDIPTRCWSRSTFTANDGSPADDDTLTHDVAISKQSHEYSVGETGCKC